MAKTALYQITYSNDVAEAVDPLFPCFDCRDDPAPDKRETYHMQRFFRCGRHLESEYTGLFSPKFQKKTGLSASEFSRFIDKNPGVDVYFINPYPHLAYLYFNAWDHGEQCHPGLTDLANQVFAAAGLAVDVRTFPRQTGDTLLYCNFWAGNARFWALFMDFVGTIAAAVDRLPPATREQIYQDADHSAPATYYAFIFERLFSTFVMRHPDIRILAFPQGPEAIDKACETPMDRLLVGEWRGAIDAWDSAGGDEGEQRRLFARLGRIRQLYTMAYHRLRNVLALPDQSLLEAATVHMAQGRLNEAHALCLDALEDSPDSHAALHLLGAGANRRGEYLWASRLLDAALGGDRGVAAYHLEKARASQGLGRPDSALASARRAVAIDPSVDQGYQLISELVMPGEDYLAVLRRFHQTLAPRSYLEIGVAEGASLSLASPPTVAVGIDPTPHPMTALKAVTKIFTMTSDDYFARRDLAQDLETDRVDLVFLDGAHFFDATLRDFINVERFAGPRTVLLIHDCLAYDEVTAGRDRTTVFWTGDVWKVPEILRQWRPDLDLFIVPTPPTGLAVVTGLDSGSTVLAERFQEIVGQWGDRVPERGAFQWRQDRDRLGIVDNDWSAIARRLKLRG